VRFVWLIGQPDEWMGWFLIAFAACSAVVGALDTVGQRDLKRLLGYSSTENVGIAGIGFGVGCLGLAWGNATLVALGFAGGLTHVLNHAFFECQLFYAAGAVYQSTHTVIEELGGLARRMPRTALAFLTGGIAISALPLLNGFTSEFTIYSGLFTQAAIPVAAKVGLVLAGVALAFVGAVSALGITRAFGVAFLGSPREAAPTVPVEVSRWMLVPMGAHALGVILLGVAPALGFLMVQGPVDIGMALVPGADHSVLAALSETLTRVGAISGGLVLTVVLLVWLRGRLSAQWRATRVPWGCGYGSPNARMR